MIFICVRPPPPDGPNPNPGPDPRGWRWYDIRNGLIGAIAGVITVAVLGNHFAGSGITGLALLAFAGGKFGADLIGGGLDMAVKSKA